MAIVDKIQGALDRMTKDDTRVTSAELTALQQTYAVAQLGHIKNEFYLSQVKDDGLRGVLQAIGDEVLKPGMERSRRMLEKANVPLVQLNAESRVAQFNRSATQVLNDQEIALDAMYWLQMGTTVAQASALAAIRGDVRDFYLHQRDANMDQWRKLGMVVFRLVPNAIPPQVTVSGQASP